MSTIRGFGLFIVHTWGFGLFLCPLLGVHFKDVAKTADEKAWLAAYKKDLAELNSTQAVLDENRAVVRELLFKAGRTTEENERLKKATVRVKTLSERLDSYK